MPDVAPIITASEPLINGQNGLFVLVLAFASLSMLGLGTAGWKVFNRLMSMFDRLMTGLDGNTQALVQNTQAVKDGFEQNGKAMSEGFKACTEANKAIAKEVKHQTDFLRGALYPSQEGQGWHPSATKASRLTQFTQQYRR